MHGLIILKGSAAKTSQFDVWQEYLTYMSVRPSAVSKAAMAWLQLQTDRLIHVMVPDNQSTHVSLWVHCRSALRE